jgi:hypothetical protein
MHLKPRYSLLTLLILTALVAGGAKLWRGPHRAVEQKTPTWEIEYSYYNEWGGVRVTDGLKIDRITRADETYEQVTVAYYRNGSLVPWSMYILDPKYDLSEDFPVRADLSAQEYAELQQAVEAERQKFVQQGITKLGIVCGQLAIAPH